MNPRTDPRNVRPISRRAQRDGVTTTRQPRPQPRRQGTRRDIVAAAIREA
jgi:hypothetical protein